MAQQVKALVAKPDDLSVTPRVHITEGELTPTSDIHPHTHTKKKTIIKT